MGETNGALVSTFAVAAALTTIANLTAIPADVLRVTQHVILFDSATPLIGGRHPEELAGGYLPVPGVLLPFEAEDVSGAAGRAHGRLP
jgi:hypothetical protein